MKVKHVVILTIVIMSLAGVIAHQIWPSITIPSINIQTNIANRHQTTNNYFGTHQYVNPVTPNKIAKITRHAKIDTKRIPDGYFIALQRIEPVIIALIQNNFDDIDGIRPDVSVGNSFDAHIKKKSPELHAKRIDCSNLYDATQTTPVPFACYPVELAPEFDSFLNDIYLTKQFPFYLARLQQIKQESRNPQ